MKKVLFISSSIPPVEESQTIRNVYLIRGLYNAGFKIDVVTLDLDISSLFMLDKLPKDVKVHRTRQTIYDKLQAKISKISFEKLRCFLKSVVAVFFGWLVFPDVRGEWSRAVVDTSLELFANNVPDILVSSSGSFTGHVAASKLAKMWNIPWVADYGDPWSFNPQRPANLYHIKKINYNLESSALRYCSAITVTTEQTAIAFIDFLQKINPIPVTSIPCGYSEELSQIQPSTSIKKNIKIAYIGTASAGSRDLRIFINIFLKLSSFKFFEKTLVMQIIGAHSRVFQKMIQDNDVQNIEITGWVSYFQSLEYMKSADILLLYGNVSKLQIPGKAYNYLYSGKPIIYLSQLPFDEDPTYQMLLGFPGIVSIQLADTKLLDKVQHLLETLPEITEDARKRIDMPSIQQFNWNNIGYDFSTVVNQALIDWLDE